MVHVYSPGPEIFRPAFPICIFVSRILFTIFYRFYLLYFVVFIYDSELLYVLHFIHRISIYCISTYCISISLIHKGSNRLPVFLNSGQSLLIYLI